MITYIGSQVHHIAVAVACNIDLISYVPRMPALGETLHGTRFQMGFGGKGANQAVAEAPAVPGPTPCPD